MKIKIVILFIVQFCIAYLTVKSQNANYTFHNYTLKDGLAGNNVYCATQDKEGFIWFGTETGLSRFDGTHFKNYTVADGLPDNEIINIFTDSKGRIWLIPFKKSLCYIFKRKVFNSTNDSILKKIKLLGNCYNITEDNEHRIIIHDTKAIHIIEANGQIKNINAELIGPNAQFVNIYKTITGNIYVLTKREVFKLLQNNLKKVFTLAANNYSTFSTTGQVVTDSSIFISNSISFNKKNFQKALEHFFFKKKIILHNSFRISGLLENLDNKLYTTTSEGVKFISINKSPLTENIIFDKPVNRLFFDSEKNTYLLTKSKGVYVKTNSEIKQKLFSNNGLQNWGIDYLNGKENNLYIGASNNNPILADKNNLNNINILSNIKSHEVGLFGEANYPISYFTKDVKNSFIVANALGMFVLEKKNWNNYKVSINIKYVQNLGNYFLVGAEDKLIILNKSNKKITDTLWNERTTTTNFIDNNYYIGTINGLYKLTINKESTYLGDSSHIFQRGISSIKKGPDGTIWIGTYDAGIVAYKNGKILQIINDSSGLTSNICRNLFVNGNYMWVGTDKGLNKIDISKPPYKTVINYTTTDGLASNMINAVYADSNMVYVGTPEGLTFFDETKITSNSKCDMRILGITVSDKELQWDSAKITLKHTDNNIRFDFVGLSFKSAGDIAYTYRLLGLKRDEWKTTRENYLEYPSLPSGSYSFEVYATNKFGVKSDIVKIDFEIEKTLFEKTWFRLLLLFLTLGLIYFYLNNRTKKIKERAREKQITMSKLNEMEQMALRSQMNPHFIFNCLNSIQDYVINSDVKGANKFITDFSRLIRSTLDNSSKKTITIEDEIKYLTNYLTIEQYRFENKFTYEITTDKSINLSENFIPPMLIQPYVENALRHGINNKKEGVGLIQINILKRENKLICEIIDNGIGRKAAKELKGLNNIEYQSKGMQLTAKRIELLNKNIENDIKIKIEDVETPKMGTKVTVSIPLI